jgi:hypothetical protein
VRDCLSLTLVHWRQASKLHMQPSSRCVAYRMMQARQPQAAEGQHMAVSLQTGIQFAWSDAAVRKAGNVQRGRRLAACTCCIWGRLHGLIEWEGGQWWCTLCFSSSLQCAPQCVQQCHSRGSIDSPEIIRQQVNDVRWLPGTCHHAQGSKQSACTRHREVVSFRW